MQFSVWLFVIDVFFWLAVFMLHAVEFYEVSLSSFELKRRAKGGDADARALEEREGLMPRLETIRRILEAIFLAVATALTIALFGWIAGTLFAAALGLLVGTITRFSIVGNLADKLYQPYENKLLSVIASWHWLDVLRGVTHVPMERGAASKAELGHIVELSSAVLSHDELLRLKASLTLEDDTVKDIMTPVSVIDTVDVNEGLGPLVLDNLHKTGHSRFPVIRGDVNHVVGVLYLHDIINLKSAKTSVAEAMDKRVYYIHENQSLKHALHGFLRTHHHLFVVVNDYRETVGVLTLEDVLERSLGKKIVDEFDTFEDLRAVAESNPRKNNVPRFKTDI
jgi:CBS domain containing-hemolysin-like protein